jgi:hypothetical protein
MLDLYKVVYCKFYAKAIELIVLAVLDLSIKLGSSVLPKIEQYFSPEPE